MQTGTKGQIKVKTNIPDIFQAISHPYEVFRSPSKLKLKDYYYYDF